MGNNIIKIKKKKKICQDEDEGHYDIVGGLFRCNIMVALDKIFLYYFTGREEVDCIAQVSENWRKMLPHLRIWSKIHQRNLQFNPKWATLFARRRCKIKGNAFDIYQQLESDQRQVSRGMKNGIFTQFNIRHDIYDYVKMCKMDDQLIGIGLKRLAQIEFYDRWTLKKYSTWMPHANENYSKRIADFQWQSDIGAVSFRSTEIQIHEVKSGNLLQFFQFNSTFNGPFLLTDDFLFCSYETQPNWRWMLEKRTRLSGGLFSTTPVASVRFENKKMIAGINLINDLVVVFLEDVFVQEMYNYNDKVVVLRLSDLLQLRQHRVDYNIGPKCGLFCNGWVVTSHDTQSFYSGLRLWNVVTGTKRFLRLAVYSWEREMKFKLSQNHIYVTKGKCSFQIWSYQLAHLDTQMARQETRMVKVFDSNKYRHKRQIMVVDGVTVVVLAIEDDTLSFSQRYTYPIISVCNFGSFV